MKYFLLLMSFSVLSYGQINISPTPISGKIEYLDSSSMNIVFSNTSNTSVSMNLSLSPISPDTSVTGFSISTNRCLGKTLLPKQSCYALISFNKNLISNGQTKEVELRNGMQALTILRGNNQLNSGQSSFVQSQLNFSDSVKSLNAEIINQTNSIQSYSVSLSGVDASKFSIISTRCSSIKPNEKCIVSLRVNQNLINGSYSASLTSGSLSLPISALISSSSFSNLSEASFMSSMTSLNFGSFTNQIQSSNSKIITLTNIGQVSGQPIIEVPAGVQIDLNRCSSIKPSQTCSFSVSFQNSQSLVTTGQNYNGNILIKKNISDSSPIVIPVQSVLLDRCLNSGFEYSQLLNTCVDMRPKINTALAGFVNPTAFTGNNTQNLGIFTPTMNGAMDIILFKKDPKGGVLSYTVETGTSLSSLTALTEVPQATNNGTYPTNPSQFFSYINSSPMFQNQNPYFRLFFPYNSASGVKTLFVKITATSSVSGYSNSLVLSSTYQNDLKFPYLRVEASGNTSQNTIREVSSSILNSPSTSLVNYRDILYVNPSQNLVSFKIKPTSFDVSLASGTNANAKEQFLITEAANVASGGLVNSKIMAFYEYNHADSSFYRVDSLDNTQSLTCSRNSSNGEITCAGANSNFASTLHGKIIQLRYRVIATESLSSRSTFFNYLVLNNINGTPCTSSPDTVASPFHGIKVVDWNNDGKIQATDVYHQICNATQLRSLSYSSLTTPVGLPRQSQVNYRLESDIDMSSYYSGGGYKFYIRQLLGHFDGQGHKISNFNVDVTQNTKNNSSITTSEATVGPDLGLGNGGYSGTGSANQIGIFGRLIGARVDNLIIENSKVLASGWTSVGSLAGLAYFYNINQSLQGAVNFSNLTSDSNVGAPSKNTISNVTVKGLGFDGNGLSNLKVKGASTVGGLVGGISGDLDSNSQFVVNPFLIEKTKVSNVSLETNNLFTQGAITIGGFAGSASNGRISKSSAMDIHFKDVTQSDYVFAGGFVGYSAYLKMNDSSLIGMKGQFQASSIGNVALGGIIGVEEDRIVTSSPTVYYPTKSNYTRLFVAYDLNLSNFTMSGGFVNVGKFHGYMRNSILSDSIAIGELNASDYLSTFNSVYAGAITSGMELNPPTDSTITNVETESYGGMNKCGIANAMCDANPTIPLSAPADYLINPLSGSPAIQSWDFSTVWRSPSGVELSGIPYLIGL